MRKRPLGLPSALSLAGLLLSVPLLAACTGDDEPEGDGGAGTSSGGLNGGAVAAPSATAGPKEPSDREPDCPFGAKALTKELGLNFLAKDNCVFVVKKGPARISVAQHAAADNETFEETRATYEEGWQNYEELEVDGYGYAVWSDDALNIAIGYLDNAGEYRYTVSGVDLEQVGTEDVPTLAEQLVALTVDTRGR